MKKIFVFFEKQSIIILEPKKEAKMFKTNLIKKDNQDKKTFFIFAQNSGKDFQYMNQKEVCCEKRNY